MEVRISNDTGFSAEDTEFIREYLVKTNCAIPEDDLTPFSEHFKGRTVLIFRAQPFIQCTSKGTASLSVGVLQSFLGFGIKTLAIAEFQQVRSSAFAEVISATNPVCHAPIQGYVVEISV